MNAEKLTQKSAEAIRSAQEIALEYGNPQIEQVHLLWALLQDSEGLIPPAAGRDGGDGTLSSGRGERPAGASAPGLHFGP